MAIVMTGGIYCPLSPRDPQHRLHALVLQIQSRLVLVHCLTKAIFDDAIMTVKIDCILTNINLDIDVTSLSSVEVRQNNIVYTIFTSGSTGKPKAVNLFYILQMIFIAMFL
jgi:acyl-coenzyme A synthetase/AMP-(fatty) acid ligase